jgi:hypothetical protein
MLGESGGGTSSRPILSVRGELDRSGLGTNSHGFCHLPREKNPSRPPGLMRLAVSGSRSRFAAFSNLEYRC